MQTPHRPRKWERGNIYFQFEHDHSALQNILTVIPIAQVINIGDGNTSGLGRNLSEAVRHLEIGGVVYDFLVERDNESGFTPPNQGDAGYVDARILLVSDRLDALIPPAPVALQTNWFTNTQPLTGLAEAQDEQTQFPTQIHRQHFRRCSFGSFDLASVSGSVARTVTVEALRGSSNLRLRLRLSDEDVLAFHLATHIDSAAEQELGLAVRITITGTIFYRYVFGNR